MIRHLRLWTGEDGNSFLDEGIIALTEGERGDLIGKSTAAQNAPFRETASDGSFEWHQDPEPSHVITLSRTPEFETKSGTTFADRL